MVQMPERGTVVGHQIGRLVADIGTAPLEAIPLIPAYREAMRWSARKYPNVEDRARVNIESGIALGVFTAVELGAPILKKAVQASHELHKGPYDVPKFLPEAVVAAAAVYEGATLVLAFLSGNPGGFVARRILASWVGNSLLNPIVRTIKTTTSKDLPEAFVNNRF